MEMQTQPTVDPAQVGFVQPGAAAPGQPPAPPNPMSGPGGWMPAPGGSDVPTNVPPGLEYLTFLDQVLVQQVVELLEGDYN